MERGHELECWERASVNRETGARARHSPGVASLLARKMLRVRFPVEKIKNSACCVSLCRFVVSFVGR